MYACGEPEAQTRTNSLGLGLRIIFHCFFSVQEGVAHRLFETKGFKSLFSIPLFFNNRSVLKPLFRGNNRLKVCFQPPTSTKFRLKLCNLQHLVDFFFPRETTPSTPSRHKTTNRQFQRGGPFRVLTRSVLCDNASIVPRGWRCEVTTEPGKFTQDGPFFFFDFLLWGHFTLLKNHPRKVPSVGTKRAWPK